MSQELTGILAAQTQIALHNVQTMLLTCDLGLVLCEQPVWKHVYHTLHSCDHWFIDPARFTEPSFHQPGLDSLDVAPAARALTRDELLAYYETVRTKVMAYLGALTDDQLAACPEGCPYTRLALVMGQFRHMYAHLGNINATTIMATGRWPRVVGLEDSMMDGLYE